MARVPDVAPADIILRAMYLYNRAARGRWLLAARRLLVALFFFLRTYFVTISTVLLRLLHF